MFYGFLDLCYVVLDFCVKAAPSSDPYIDVDLIIFFVFNRKFMPGARVIANELGTMLSPETSWHHLQLRR